MVQCVKERPGQVGVAGVVVAACGVGVLAPAGGDGFADRHQRLGHVGPASIEFEPALVDYVVGLEYQAGFDFGRVAEGGDRREELAHLLGHAAAQTGYIDADVSHPVAVADALDERGLRGEVHATELVAFEDAELATRYQRRRDHDHARTVARLSRVVANPDLSIAKRTHGKGFVVLGPLDPAVHHARLQQGQRKDARAVVDEFAHQQVGERLRAVFAAQFLNVEQVTTAPLRVQDRDNLAPQPIFTEPALLESTVGHVNLRMLRGGLAFVEAFARPEGVRLVGQALRRSQQQRIIAQQNPNGSKYAPRKQRNLRGKLGRVKRKVKMFRKLRTASFLRVQGDRNAISVGFTGRIARIARVHQYGLKDRAEKGAPSVGYEQRELLGLTEADLDIIRDQLLTHLTP